MRVTILNGELEEPAVVNPECCDGARRLVMMDGGSPWTMLLIGPEEVRVKEDFDAIAAALEDAWEARRRSVAVDALLEPLTPLAQILPLLVPMALQQINAWRTRGAAPPQPAPSAPPVDDDGDPRQDDVAPAGPLDAIPPLEPVACKNCGRSSAPQRLCPGCGAVLVGEG